MRLIDADALIPTEVHTVVVLRNRREQLESVLYAEQVDDAPTVEPASPWHRVEEEMPEPIHPTDPRYKAYLICDSLGYMHVADYTYSKHFPTCYSFHVNGEEETDVKYWMPLPEPPKEDA